MCRPRVYISGPITKGDRNHNYFQSVDVQRKLMLAGFAPLNPMATMTLPFAWEPDFPWQLWLDCDFPWIEVCEAVLRIPGYSVGADAELAFAQERGIPVFYAMEDLIEWRKGLEVAA